MDKVILEAKGLIKSYVNGNNKLKVLDGIGIKLEEGKIVTIMGKSGSGKSTLLNILSTLDSTDEGMISINGNDINYYTDDDISYMRNSYIGFVFQFHHLLHEFNVIENLIIPQLLHKKDILKAKIIGENLLEKLGMNQLKNRHPSQISGGEKQRVAVLRAIVNNPGIVLADEPTGNLDRKNSQKVLDLLEQIKANYHTSIIIATHDDSIIEIADKCFLINKGSLKEI